MNKENRLRGKKFSLFVYLFFFLFFISLVGALDVFEDSNVVGVNIQPPQIPVLLPDTDWNGGWMNGGCSIEGGNIYCQQAFLYNITSLNVTKKNLTILDNLIIDGRVGIGTTTPSGELEVVGNTMVSYATASGSRLDFLPQSDGETQIKLNAYTGTPKLRFVDSSGTLSILTMLNTGNVGIGADPHAVIKFKAQASTSGNYVGYFNNIHATNGDGLLIDAGDDADTNSLTVRTHDGGSNLFLVRGDGNVGIGASSPDVNLNIEFADAAAFNTGAPDPQLKITNTDTTDGNFAGIWLRSDSSDGFINLESDSINVGNLVFYTDNSGISEKMRIEAGGNVGIGTSSPDEKLHIKGTVNERFKVEATNPNGIPGIFIANDVQSFLFKVDGGNSDKLIIRDVTNTVDRLAIDTSGNVGIGTSSPSELLHLNLSSANLRVRLQANAGFDKVLTFFNQTSQVGSFGYDDSEGTMFISSSTPSVQAISILRSGKVGIGTTTPQNLLNVIGSINQTQGNLIGDMVYGSMNFHNDTDGNVIALTEDAWNNFTGFDQDSNMQLLHSVLYSSSKLIIQEGGVYDIKLDASFTGTVNNKYHVEIGIGGVHQDFCETHDRISTGTDVLSASTSCFLQLNAGDDITLMFMNEDSGGDATVLSASVNLHRIGN